ncbi:MAG TPA: ATP-binding protein [Alphaproteobacteria bacterium]|nr:ATP-binding protein [Alphaproteobacteria bacterium]
MSSAPIETADRTSDAKPERLGIGARIKSFLPRTIEGRTLAIIVIPVFIAQILTPILFFERHFSSLSRGLAFAVAGDIATIIDDMEREPSNQRQIFADARRTLELTVDLEPGATLAPRVGPRWNPLIEPVLMTALQERVGLPFTIGSSGADEAAEIRVQLPQGVLDVLAPQHRLFSYTAFVFIGWVIGVPIVLTWIAIIFMRNQVRPIRRLAVAAESFGRGVDTVRLRPAGALEVRQAAAAFIVMRDRIRRQIAQRTEMLAGVSHDLRTPLTRMKLQLALLRNEPEAEELRADIAEMEGMIEAYLAFARGEGAETPQATDLAAMLGEIVNGLPAKAPATLSIDAPIEIAVRPVAMRRCLSNLIGNAARYARRVEITASRKPGTVSIVIDDDGPGIPVDKREEVFRPFVRLDPSRNIETGGVGLGLTVAREIAHGHGGEINLEDSPLGGLRVVLTLPG